MVKRGEFDYGALTKIYCVAILAKNILPCADYHTLANLRSEKAEIFDEQMTFVTVELVKSTLQETDCQTDLEKLIYTMKTIHTVTRPTQFPKFWDEEWLRVAIDELDSRKMTPDEKASLEILIARNAEAVKAEGRKIKQSKEAERKAAQIETITKSLARGLDIELIADISGVSVDFVNAVKTKTSAN